MNAPWSVQVVPNNDPSAMRNALSYRVSCSWPSGEESLTWIEDPMEALNVHGILRLRSRQATSVCGFVGPLLFLIDVDRNWNVESYQVLLSEDERARASQFRFQCDRHRFVLCRAKVRIALSQITGRSPESLRFGTNAFGKPKLLGTDLELNWSNSGNLALLGVCRDRLIGVDVERIRDIKDIDNIVRRHFSPAELRHYLRTPSDNRRGEFFRMWTLKEAVLKGMGLGLSHPLRFVDLTSMRDGCLMEWHCFGPESSRSWELTTFSLMQDYSAAVAIQRSMR